MFEKLVSENSEMKEKIKSQKTEPRSKMQTRMLNKGKQIET